MEEFPVSTTMKWVGIFVLLRNFLFAAAQLHYGALGFVIAGQQLQRHHHHHWLSFSVRTLSPWPRSDVRHRVVRSALSPKCLHNSPPPTHTGRPRLICAAAAGTSDKKANSLHSLSLSPLSLSLSLSLPAIKWTPEGGAKSGHFSAEETFIFYAAAVATKANIATQHRLTYVLQSVVSHSAE